MVSTGWQQVIAGVSARYDTDTQECSRAGIEWKCTWWQGGQGRCRLCAVSLRQRGLRHSLGEAQDGWEQVQPVVCSLRAGASSCAWRGLQYRWPCCASLPGEQLL